MEEVLSCSQCDVQSPVPSPMKSVRPKWTKTMVDLVGSFRGFQRGLYSLFYLLPDFQVECVVVVKWVGWHGARTVSLVENPGWCPTAVTWSSILYTLSRLATQFISVASRKIVSWTWNV